jgi:hypothetical protein
MIAQELFGDLDVPIWKIGELNFRGTLVVVSLLQIYAFHRAVHCALSFISAADRTNIATNTRTIAARFSDLTDLTFHGGSGGLPGIFHRNIRA